MGELNLSFVPGSGESSSAEEVVEACYTGIFGTCQMCDVLASCICPSYSDGYTGLILMDRTQFNERVLVCHNVKPLMLALYIFQGILSMEGTRRLVLAIRHQYQVAVAAKLNVCGCKVLWTLCSALAASTCVLIESMVGIALPTQSVGIDVLPSVFLCIRMTCITLGFELMSALVFDDASKVQESSLGRTRVAETVARRRKTSNLKILLFGPTLLIPGIEAVFMQLGYITSIESQLVFALVFYVSRVVESGSSGLQLRKDFQALRTTLDACIDNAKVSYIAAQGGVSMQGITHRIAETAMPSTPGGIDRTAERRAMMPAHLRDLLDEISELETAAETLSTRAPGLYRPRLIGALLWLLVVAIPSAWTLSEYVLTMMGVGVFATSRSLCITFRERHLIIPTVTTLKQHV